MYGRDGSPLPLSEWGRLFEEHRPVAEETVGRYRVSTVWLGIDHSFGSGPPLIFETMVFRNTYNDVYCNRYSTEQEAIEGHAHVVAHLRETGKVPTP